MVDVFVQHRAWRTISFARVATNVAQLAPAHAACDHLGMRMRSSLVAGLIVIAAIGCKSKGKSGDGTANPIEGSGAHRATGGAAIVVEKPLPPGPLVPGGDDPWAGGPRGNGMIDVAPLNTGGVLVSLTTTGLANRGIPELVLRDIPATAQHLGQEFLLSAGQAVADGAVVEKDSTIAVKPPEGEAVRVYLSREVPAASPPPPPQVDADPTVTVEPPTPDLGTIAIVFPGDGAGIHERQLDVLRRWDTSGADDVTRFSWTPEIEAAIADARKSIRTLAPRWATTAPAGETLSIDAPFEAGGDWVYLQVDVIAINGDRITGVVAAPPPANVSGGIKQGSRVNVSIDQIFDYYWTKPDGTVEGGKVGELLDGGPDGSDEGAPPG
jgi:hypothetical protein